MIIVGWIFFSIIVGALGNDRECGFFWAMICSLFLSPIVGLIYVALSENKSDIAHKNKIDSSIKMGNIKQAVQLLKDGMITKEEFEKIKKYNIN